MTVASATLTFTYFRYQLMLKCWSYSPEDRPTFRYLLEVLKSLKERTSDSIQITSQFPCKVQNGKCSPLTRTTTTNTNTPIASSRATNPVIRFVLGAIFNRSYLLSDINLNPFMAGTFSGFIPRHFAH